MSLESKIGSILQTAITRASVAICNDVEQLFARLEVKLFERLESQLLKRLEARLGVEDELARIDKALWNAPTLPAARLQPKPAKDGSRRGRPPKPFGSKRGKGSAAGPLARGTADGALEPKGPTAEPLPASESSGGERKATSTASTGPANVSTEPPAHRQVDHLAGVSKMVAGPKRPSIPPPAVKVSAPPKSPSNPELEASLGVMADRLIEVLKRSNGLKLTRADIRAALKSDVGPSIHDAWISRVVLIAVQRAGDSIVREGEGDSRTYGWRRSAD